MNKETLKVLAGKLTELASELDEVAHDDETMVLFAHQVDVDDDGLDDVWEVDSGFGALRVVGYASLKMLARWLGAKIQEEGIVR